MITVAVWLILNMIFLIAAIVDLSAAYQDYKDPNNVSGARHAFVKYTYYIAWCRVIAFVVLGFVGIGSFLTVIHFPAVTDAWIRAFITRPLIIVGLGALGTGTVLSLMLRRSLNMLSSEQET